jgi:chromosome segregation ATPase
VLKRLSYIAIEEEAMFNTSSKIPALAAGGCLVVGLLTYGIFSGQSRNDTRLNELEQQIQSVQLHTDQTLAQLAAEMKTMSEKTGLSGEELQNARSLAEQLRQEQANNTKTLRRELSAKADSKALSQFRTEATSKLAEVQQDATTKFGAVNNDLQTVRTDLDSARNELSSGIARNSSELSELRKRGERDYFEFDVRKTKDMQRVGGGLMVQLKKADVKKQRYDLNILVDDRTIEERGRFVNTPVQVLSGRDRAQYELVVNSVDKDRIRGYVSMPKDRVASSDSPQLRNKLP